MNIRSDQNQKPGLRFTALVVAFVFTATSLTWTTPAIAAPADLANPVFSSIDTLAIPAEMGTISKTYRGERGTGNEVTMDKDVGRLPLADSRNDRTVILIQDAHAVIDAQENIAKILGYLGKSYGVRLAALEGAKGRMEPILLRTFPEPIVKRKILAGYENRAELSGPEMAAVLQEEATDFRGMEDWGLYEENYFAYLRAQEKKESLLKQWSAFKQTLDSERSKIYDEKLNEFQEARENFLTERASLLDLLVYLSNFKGLLKTASGYQELPGLIDSIGYEKSGKQDALIPLVRKIADEFKVKYLRGLGVKTEMNFYNRYQALMTGQITAGQMLQYLVQLGRDNGKNVKLTPALKKLLGHAELLSEIKGSRLYDELQRFLPEVEASLLKTPAQRELAGQYEKIYLLKELITLELTHEALAKYQKDPDAYLSLVSDPTFKQDLVPALEFYQAALKRDQAFMSKIDTMMKDSKQQTVAVVAGGFHTNGLERILKEKGVAYAVVTPKITSLEGISNYAKVMKGDVSFKEYLRTTYFDGLMRHAAKALVEALPIPDRVRTLKAWRDNVIRELAKEGHITDAGKYLPYIDEILQSMPEVATAIGPKRTKEEVIDIVRKELERFKKDSFARIWKTFEFQLDIFTDGLKQLITKKDLNVQAVSVLLDRTASSKPAMLAPCAAMGLFPEVGIINALLRNIPDLSGITGKMATADQILEAVKPYAKIPPNALEEKALIEKTASDLLQHGLNVEGFLKKSQEAGKVSDAALDEPVGNMLDELASITNQKREVVAAQLARVMAEKIKEKSAVDTTAPDTVSPAPAATIPETQAPASDVVEVSTAPIQPPAGELTAPEKDFNLEGVEARDVSEDKAPAAIFEAIRAALPETIRRQEVYSRSVKDFFDQSLGGRASGEMENHAEKPSEERSVVIGLMQLLENGTCRFVVTPGVGKRAGPSEGQPQLAPIPHDALFGMAGQPFERTHTVRFVVFLDKNGDIEPYYNFKDSRSGSENPETPEVSAEIVGKMKAIMDQAVSLGKPPSTPTTTATPETPVAETPSTGSDQTSRSESRKPNEASAESIDLSKIKDQNERLAGIQERVEGLMKQWEESKDVNKEKYVFRHVARQLLMQGHWLTKGGVTALTKDLRSIGDSACWFVAEEYIKLVGEADGVEIVGMPNKAPAQASASDTPAIETPRAPAKALEATSVTAESIAPGEAKRSGTKKGGMLATMALVALTSLTGLAAQVSEQPSQQIAMNTASSAVLGPPTVVYSRLLSLEDVISDHFPGEQPSALLREVSESLRGLGVQIEVVHDFEQWKKLTSKYFSGPSMGGYDPDTDTIYLYSQVISPGLVLHEAYHALLQHLVLDRDKTSIKGFAGAFDALYQRLTDDKASDRLRAELDKLEEYLRVAYGHADQNGNITLPKTGTISTDDDWVFGLNELIAWLATLNTYPDWNFSVKGLTPAEEEFFSHHSETPEKVRKVLSLLSAPEEGPARKELEDFYKHYGLPVPQFRSVAPVSLGETTRSDQADKKEVMSEAVRASDAASAERDTFLDKFSVGVQAFNLKYSEPAMTEQGYFVGPSLRFEDYFRGRLYVQGDFEYSQGRVQYTTPENPSYTPIHPDNLLEAEGLFGYRLGDSSPLMPFIGYRYSQLTDETLYYTRISHHNLLPVGIQWGPVRLANGGTVALRGEYDFFLGGWQHSGGSEYSDNNAIEMKQDQGYGLKGSVEYRKNGYSVGVFVEKRYVGDSEVVGSGGFKALEPENTREVFGIRIGGDPEQMMRDFLRFTRIKDKRSSDRQKSRSELRGGVLQSMKAALAAAMIFGATLLPAAETGQPVMEREMPAAVKVESSEIESFVAQVLDRSGVSEEAFKKLQAFGINAHVTYKQFLAQKDDPRLKDILIEAFTIMRQTDPKFFSDNGKYLQHLVPVREPNIFGGFVVPGMPGIIVLQYDFFNGVQSAEFYIPKLDGKEFAGALSHEIFHLLQMAKGLMESEPGWKIELDARKGSLKIVRGQDPENGGYQNSFFEISQIEAILKLVRDGKMPAGWDVERSFVPKFITGNLRIQDSVPEGVIDVRSAHPIVYGILQKFIRAQEKDGRGYPVILEVNPGSVGQKKGISIHYVMPDGTEGYAIANADYLKDAPLLYQSAKPKKVSSRSESRVRGTVSEETDNHGDYWSNEDDFRGTSAQMERAEVVANENINFIDTHPIGGALLGLLSARLEFAVDHAGRIHDFKNTPEFFNPETLQNLQDGTWVEMQIGPAYLEKTGAGYDFSLRDMEKTRGMPQDDLTAIRLAVTLTAQKIVDLRRAWFERMEESSKEKARLQAQLSEDALRLIQATWRALDSWASDDDSLDILVKREKPLAFDYEMREYVKSLDAEPDRIRRIHAFFEKNLPPDIRKIYFGTFWNRNSPARELKAKEQVLRAIARSENRVAEPWVELGKKVNARWVLKLGLEYAVYAAVFSPSILPFIVGWDLLEAALPKTFFDKFLSGKGASYGVAAGLKFALLAAVSLSFNQAVLGNIFWFLLIDYFKFKFGWDPTGEAHEQGVFLPFGMAIHARFLSTLIRGTSFFDSLKKAVEDALHPEVLPPAKKWTPEDRVGVNRSEPGVRGTVSDRTANHGDYWSNEEDFQGTPAQMELAEIVAKEGPRSEIRNWTDSGLLQLSIGEIARSFFEEQRIGPGENLWERSDLQGLIDQWMDKLQASEKWYGGPESLAQFREYLHALLSAANREEWDKEKAGLLTPEILIMAVQRVHTLWENPESFGVQKEMLQSLLLRDIVKQMLMSHAERYAFLEGFGFVGPVWQKVSADQAMQRALGNGELNRVLQVLSRPTTLSKMLPLLKAVSEHYGMDLAKVAHRFMLNAMEQNATHSFGVLVSENFRKHIAQYVLSQMLESVTQILLLDRALRRNFGMHIQRFMARGFDSLVSESVSTDGTRSVAKLMMPVNGFTPQQFSDILTHVTEITNRSPRFARNLGIYVLELQPKQSSILEIDERVEGETLKEVLSAGSKISLTGRADLAEQLLEIHEYLSENGMSDRDVSNLNNVILDRKQLLRHVDFGNISPTREIATLLAAERKISESETESILRRGAKRKLILAAIKILTGQNLLAGRDEEMGQSEVALFESGRLEMLVEATVQQQGDASRAWILEALHLFEKSWADDGKISDLRAQFQRFINEAAAGQVSGMAPAALAETRRPESRSEIRREGWEKYKIRDARLPETISSDLMVFSPIFNEPEEQLQKVIDQAREGGYLNRLIFVDDGSKNPSAAVFEKNSDAFFISFSVNRQKEGSIQRTVEYLKEFRNAPPYFVALDGDSFLNVQDGAVALSLTKTVAQMENAGEVARPMDIAAQVTEKSNFVEWLQAVQWFSMMKFRNFRARLFGRSAALLGGGVIFRTDKFLEAMAQKKTGFAAGDIELSGIMSRLGKVGMPVTDVTVKTEVLSDWGSFLKQRERWFQGTWEAVPGVMLVLTLGMGLLIALPFLMNGVAVTLIASAGLWLGLFFAGSSALIIRAVSRRMNPAPIREVSFSRDVVPFMPFYILLQAVTFVFYLLKTGIEYALPGRIQPKLQTERTEISETGPPSTDFETGIATETLAGRSESRMGEESHSVFSARRALLRSDLWLKVSRGALIAGVAFFAFVWISAFSMNQRYDDLIHKTSQFGKPNLISAQAAPLIRGKAKPILAENPLFRYNIDRITGLPVFENLLEVKPVIQVGEPKPEEATKVYFKNPDAIKRVEIMDQYIRSHWKQIADSVDPYIRYGVDIGVERPVEAQQALYLIRRIAPERFKMLKDQKVKIFATKFGGGTFAWTRGNRFQGLGGEKKTINYIREIQSPTQLAILIGGHEVMHTAQLPSNLWEFYAWTHNLGPNIWRALTVSLRVGTPTGIVNTQEEPILYESEPAFVERFLQMKPANGQPAFVSKEKLELGYAESTQTLGMMGFMAWASDAITLGILIFLYREARKKNRAIGEKSNEAPRPTVRRSSFTPRSEVLRGSEWVDQKATDAINQPRETKSSSVRSEVRGVPSFAEILSYNKESLSDPRQWKLSELDQMLYDQMSQWDAEKLGNELRKFFQEGMLVPINDTSLLKVKGGEDFLRKFIKHLINGSDSLRKISKGKLGGQMSHYWSPADTSPDSILGVSLISKYSDYKFQEYRGRYRAFLIRLVNYWDEIAADKTTQKMFGAVLKDKKAWESLSKNFNRMYQYSEFPDWKKIVESIRAAQKAPDSWDVSAEENRRRGVFFYEGQARSEALIFEFSKDQFTQLSDPNVSKAPESGVMYQPQGVGRTRIAWRSVDFSKFPPTRIWVDGLDAQTVRKFFADNGFDVIVEQVKEGQKFDGKYTHAPRNGSLEIAARIAQSGGLLSTMEIGERSSFAQYFPADEFAALTGLERSQLYGLVEARVKQSRAKQGPSVSAKSAEKKKISVKARSEVRKKMPIDPVKASRDVLKASLAASNIKPSSQKAVLQGFEEWSLKNGKEASAYLQDKLLLYSNIGKHLLDEIPTLIPMLTARSYYRTLLSPAQAAQADRVLRNAMVDAGVYDDNDTMGYFFLISEQIRKMDREVVERFSASKDFTGLAKYYFDQYARPGEVFAPGAIRFKSRDTYQSQWALTVEEAVLESIARSRAAVQEATGFNSMPPQAQEQIRTAQGLLDRYFPAIFGRPFPLDLTKTVLLTTEFMERADPISMKILINEDSFSNLRTFIRLVIHEGLHLGSRVDETLVYFDAIKLQEGLTEFLTQRIFDESKKDGLKVEYEYQSQNYMRYVEALKALVIDHLLEGNVQPLIEAYNSGDAVLLGQKLGQAVQKKGGEEVFRKRTAALGIAGYADFESEIETFISSVRSGPVQRSETRAEPRLSAEAVRAEPSLGQGADSDVYRINDSAYKIYRDISLKLLEFYQAVTTAVKVRLDQKEIGSVQIGGVDRRVVIEVNPILDVYEMAGKRLSRSPLIDGIWLRDLVAGNLNKVPQAGDLREVCNAIAAPDRKVLGSIKTMLAAQSMEIMSKPMMIKTGEKTEKYNVGGITLESSENVTLKLDPNGTIRLIVTDIASAIEYVGDSRPAVQVSAKPAPSVVTKVVAKERAPVKTEVQANAKPRVELPQVVSPLVALAGVTAKQAITGAQKGIENFRSELRKKGQAQLRTYEATYDRGAAESLEKLLKAGDPVAVIVTPEFESILKKDFPGLEVVDLDISSLYQRLVVAVRVSTASSEEGFLDVDKTLDHESMKEMLEKLQAAIASENSPRVVLLMNRPEGNSDAEAFLNMIKNLPIEQLIVFYLKGQSLGASWLKAAHGRLTPVMVRSEDLTEKAGRAAKAQDRKVATVALSSGKDLGVGELGGILKLLLEAWRVADPDLRDIVFKATDLMIRMFASASEVERAEMLKKPELLLNKLKERTGLDLKFLKGAGGALSFDLKTLVESFVSRQAVEKAA